MDDNWINDLRNKLDNPKRPVPDGLWEDISTTLQTKKEASGRRRIVMWCFSGITAAAAAVALVITVGNFQSSERNNSGNLTASTGKTERIEIVTPEYTEPEDVLQSGEKLLADATVQAGNHSSQATGARNERKGTVTEETGTAADVEEKTVTAGDTDVNGKAVTDEYGITGTDVNVNIKDNGSGTDVKDGKVFNPSENGNSRLDGSWDFPETEEDRSSRFRNGRFSIGVSGVNGMSANESSDGYCSPILSVLRADREEGHYGNLMISNYNDEITSEMRHRMPVRAGLSVRYSLTERLSVESGLTYTMLSSDFDSGDDGKQYKMNQKLRYIGIPLNLNYSFIKKDRYEVYLTGGGMAEKCLGGKRETTYVMDGNALSTESEFLKVKPLQYSVNAGAGLQANISKLLGVYVEPVASYYFNNGSDVESLYSEKPLNFNLKLGLRLNF